MNRSWFIYYGHKMGMSREETLSTRYGEFMDLLNCDAISSGRAKYKRPARRMGLEDLMRVR